MAILIKPVLQKAQFAWVDKLAEGRSGNASAPSSGGGGDISGDGPLGE